MRCTRIEFKGYKRLLDAGCNVDDRLVAFVGPNEAGKTSVLRGLAWIDEPGSSALAGGLASRGQDPNEREDGDKIVTATYRLEPLDWEALENLPFERVDDARYTYWLSRDRDGDRHHGIIPRLRREPAPFTNAIQSLKKAPKALKNSLAKASQDWGPDDVENNPQHLFDRMSAILDDPNTTWSGAEQATLREFASWLDGQAGANGVASFGIAAANLRSVADVMESDHPNDEALSILDTRRPLFREFSPDDRDLPNEFDTNQGSDTIARPFKRILDMAGTSVDDLKAIWADEGARDTRLEECNELLSAIFAKAWSQSDLTVRLKAEHHLLKVQVKIVENGVIYYSTFGERSEGLKAFVALVGFLNALPEEAPPILLIDEAETHLHIDAQADLVQVLQDKVQATQIFYTTHSPGCLPLDLGRGLRFVEPTDEHYSSTISHNFWDSKYPGFSSVLFKMGAAAFAFSSLRNAVLAEGAGDMILLPTLIRLATDKDTLPYQIAPRLNDFDEEKFTSVEVAANVAYLIDGDGGGRDKGKNLRRKHHVPPNLIVSHPRGYAAEDYVEPRLLLDVIRELRTDGERDSKPIVLSALPEGETMGQRLDRWFEAERLTGPGKVAIATRLANLGSDLKLKSGAKTRLQKVHDEITQALASRPGKERPETPPPTSDV